MRIERSGFLRELPPLPPVAGRELYRMEEGALMTLKDVRAFAWIVADWCVCQDDLTGFGVNTMGNAVVVRLEWQSDGEMFFASHCFSKSEIDRARDPSWLLDGLDEVADQARVEIRARARARRLADPNRLPG